MFGTTWCHCVEKYNVLFGVGSFSSFVRQLVVSIVTVMLGKGSEVQR